MKQVIEGKIEDEVSEDIVEELDSILDEDFALPTEPREKFKLNTKQSNLAYKWYLKIQPDLRDWWEEFNTSLDDKGNQKYRSVYQFAKYKGKNKLETAYIYEMIGPRPVLKEGRQLRVPWLGDWMLRRSQGFWAPTNPKQVRTLAKAFKDRVTGWEAVRSAAPFLAHIFARLMKMGEMVDQAFLGQMFDPNLKTTDPENLSRARLYREFQKMMIEDAMKVMDKWMEIHGVDPKNPIQVNQTNNLNQFANPLGIPELHGELTPLMKDTQVLKLAKQLNTHAKNFNMPLPETLQPKDPEPVKEPVIGKTKVQ